jgi:hypothetical protein
MKKYCFLIMMLAGTSILYAQEKTELTTRQMLETKNFIFKAQTVNPQRGRLRQLTSEYDVVVTNDTVIAFLPYFGRAYSAPIDPSEGGIKFTSGKFDYSLTAGKKKSWTLKIKPDDIKDVQDLYFTIFENKKATLLVNSMNRESILFNGYIIEGKDQQKKAF